MKIRARLTVGTYSAGTTIASICTVVIQSIGRFQLEHIVTVYFEYLHC